VNRQRKKGEEILGELFGRLTVLERDDDYIYKGQPQARYICECGCGQQVTVRRCHLLAGKIRSCGCWRRQRARRTIEKNRGR
jgi:hypothetical protein